jgi:hypothetical protein
VKLRILIIDDQPDSVKPLQDEIKEKLPEADSRIVDFGAAQTTIAAFEPDIIVLDLLRETTEEAPGLDVWEFIWEKRFCPLVFYTAFPERLEQDDRSKHPFVRSEKKGGGSEERVIAHIHGFDIHVSALIAVGTEIRGVLNRMLKEVAHRAFSNVKEPSDVRDMLTRMARRRVAAAMDDRLSTGGPNLRSWEHYLCPPLVDRHLLTGDIIRKRDGDPTDPTQYAVVLTPSCDLVADGHRKPKVERVLVALCTNVKRLLQDLNLDIHTNREKCKERLLPMLNQGYGTSCLPLPGLPGAFPAMAADFRNLELISLKEIGNDKEPFLRVASVDTPFRELVAWAYITNAARPGLPDRDFESWADEIIAALPKPAPRE